MAHLFTRHDPFHLHKTFGLFALLNFLLRFYYVVRFGTSFPATESKSFACASVFIHAMLPAVSLFLPLPSKRNFASPMIWPEFRLHSVLFSSRHVMSTLVTLLELWPTQIWGSQTAMPVLAECALKVALVRGVVSLAGMITKCYGSRENRTTNTMPYPENVTESEQARIKLEYARCQFGATIFAVVPATLPIASTLNFAPLYAIQAAPFMMTLVRKGKCGARAYHRVYSFWLVYPKYMYLS